MSSALQGVGVVCSGRRAWRGWRGGHRVLEEPEAEEVTRRSPRSPAPLRTPLRPVQSAAAEPRRGRGGGLAGLAQPAILEDCMPAHARPPQAEAAQQHAAPGRARAGPPALPGRAAYPLARRTKGLV
ncbi:unnamed protein product [Lampetra planeri]